MTPSRWLALGALGPDGERRWNRKGGAIGHGKYPMFALGSGGGWSWGTNGHRAHLVLGEREHPEPDGVLRSVTVEQMASASEGALVRERRNQWDMERPEPVKVGTSEFLSPHIGSSDSVTRVMWQCRHTDRHELYLPVEEACVVPEGAELRSLIQIERAKSSEKEEDIRERLTRPKWFRLDKYRYNPFYLRDALRGLLHQMKGEKPRLLWARFPKEVWQPLALLSGSSIESADRMALVQQIKE